ncbi:hypothetical protein F4803DRAFT_556961 [Xylaria telfairii]|nr:hypothetical protein F4803DRAFT_556961 [Xylaria telfairii]
MWLKESPYRFSAATRSPPAETTTPSRSVSGGYIGRRLETNAQPPRRGEQRLPQPLARVSLAAVGRTVIARQEVILSADAIHSPRVLELSGVGNPELLQRLGIDFVAQVIPRDGFETLDALLQGDAAQVTLARGRVLSRASIRVARRRCPSLSSPPRKSGSGNLIVSLVHLVVVDKDKDEAKKNLRALGPRLVNRHLGLLHHVPGYTAFDMKGNALLHPGDGLYVTFAAQLAHPLSRGSTHITAATSSSSSSSLSAADVQVDPRYLSHVADVEALARHVQQLVQQVKTTEPLGSLLVAGEKMSLHSHEDLSDLEGAEEFVRKTCMGAYHFAGTCSQMSRDMGGVVDDKGRVYGCRNLRASVI